MHLIDYENDLSSVWLSLVPCLFLVGEHDYLAYPRSSFQIVQWDQSYKPDHSCYVVAY